MKVNLDYNVSKNDREFKNMSSQEMTALFIQNAVVETHPKLEGSLRRVYGRLQRKLDDTVEKGLDSIDLEDAERTLIEKSLKDAKFHPILSKYVLIFEEEFKKEEETEGEE